MAFRYLIEPLFLSFLSVHAFPKFGLIVSIAAIFLGLHLIGNFWGVVLIQLVGQRYSEGKLLGIAALVEPLPRSSQAGSSSSNRFGMKLVSQMFRPGAIMWRSPPPV